MIIKKVILRVFLLIFLLCLQGCTQSSKPAHLASNVIPFFQHWNLILGDGSNAGVAIDYENKDFFYATSDGVEKWVVFKTPNASSVLVLFDVPWVFPALGVLKTTHFSTPSLVA